MPARSAFRLAARLALPLALLCFAAACPPGDDDSADPGPFGPELGGTSLVENPTWEADVQPMMLPYCGDCHEGGAAGSGGIGWLNGHEQVTSNAIAPVCDGHARGQCLDVRVENESMPDGAPCPPGETGCITIDEYATLQAWIGAGMPE
jgi:hypothetical protein